MVREFHEKFGAPIRDGAPTVDFGRVHLRMALIAEEFAELVDAVYGEDAGYAVRQGFKHAQDADDGSRDVVEAADALADLDYVIAGMALEAGIPHPDVVEEVHRSNMSKLGADGQPVLREDGKILKGPGYFRPHIAAVLFGDVLAEAGA
jgi:predicted HAD superfamily Cof-like phosphohydrolase